jgi:hypothetical protein
MSKENARKMRTAAAAGFLHLRGLSRFGPGQSLPFWVHRFNGMAGLDRRRISACRKDPKGLCNSWKFRLSADLEEMAKIRHPLAEIGHFLEGGAI